jgi:hypothetical protein
MKHLLVVLAVTAACSKSAPDCATAIGKGMDNFSEQMKTKAPAAMQGGMAEMAASLKSTLIKRCTEDKWASEVVSCFTTVSDRPGMQACQQKLSEEQREKLMADIRSTMMGKFGGGGMKMPAGHPEALRGAIEQAEQAKDQAQQAADVATKAAQDTKQTVDKLAQDLADLDKRVSAAIEAVTAAQNDADRTAAKAKLDALQKEKAELDAKIKAAKPGDTK